MNSRLLLIFTLLLGFSSLGQQKYSFDFERSGELTFTLNGDTLKMPNPRGAYMDKSVSDLPVVDLTIPLAIGADDVEVFITDTVYRMVSSESLPQNSKGNKVIISQTVFQTGSDYQLSLFVNPYKKGAFGTLMIAHMELEVVPVQSKNQSSALKANSVQSSVLGSGDWLKIGITEDGLYRIDKQMLDNAGWNTDALDPNNIQLYGNGGGMLPELNSDSVIDDLYENSIRVIGSADGSFDAGDYVLFYAEGPHDWVFDGDHFRQEFNVYSDTNYYFVTVGNQPGKRVQTLSSSPASNVTTSTCDCYDFHERDLENIAGTGRKWFGEYFDITNSYNFTFNMPNRRANDSVWMEISAAAISSSFRTFDVLLGNTAVGSVNVPNVTTGQYADAFKDAVNDFSFITNTPNAVAVTVRYNNALSSAVGWLDYLTVNARCDLAFSGTAAPFPIVDQRVVGAGNIARYNVQSNSSFSVWNVSNPLDPVQLPLQGGAGGYYFTSGADDLEYFILHNGTGYNTPASIRSIDNQNLHAFGPTDYFIITTDNLMTEAERLAEFHRDNGLLVEVVRVDDIYNEYSTGRQDIAGIRNFLKDHYNKHDGSPNQLKYAFMFGDTSYDFKDRVPNNSNIIPTYETVRSGGIATGSYCADDFFGMFSPNEGVIETGGTLEIALGRVPIVNATQAKEVVDKILHYASSASFGDWKNRIILVADDTDQSWESGFVENSEGYSSYIDTAGPQFTFEKIYSDAYVEQTTSAGQRYPEVQEAINREINRGALITNYTGHGGELGWTGERILENADVNSWTNFDQLTTFITVTCEFTRIDDPTRVSAGELCVLNPNGGAVSLFSTTRVISAGFGYNLNNILYELFFETYDGGRVRMGDLMREVKNRISSTAKYSVWLFGDPALEFAIPKRETIITEINGIPVDQFNDTIGALSKVTISGIVVDENGVIDPTYDGVLQPTIFDKKKERITRDNSEVGALLPFWTQNNLIYKGNASISNGQWSFEFIVPKDIDYSTGDGKISLYFYNNEIDGGGGENVLAIGGTDPNPEVDTVGPSLALYMNDYSFISGGITDDSPVFLARLEDFSGINTTGNGIGHDLVAYLDGNRSNPYYLNSFYSADLDSYQSGEVRYPFNNLEDGLHHIEMIAWDVYNNSARGEIEFVVADADGMMLENLQNYPNPFIDETHFVFNHNRPNEPLEVVLRIYSSTGNLVRTLTGQVETEGYQVSGFKWDGLGESGGYVEKGVYIYHVTVRGIESGEVAHAYERLVLLR